jgi:hypothetical protein
LNLALVNGFLEVVFILIDFDDRKRFKPLADVFTVAKVLPFWLGRDYLNSVNLIAVDFKVPVHGREIPP